MKQFFALLFTLIWAGMAQAQATAQVLPGYRAPDGSHIAALRIQLEPGWKTYWRSPGDAGLPPSFDLSASSNLDQMQVVWPTPHVFESFGMKTVGYDREVIVPIRFAVPEAGAAARLTGRIDLGVCRDICVPLTLNIDAALPASGAPDPRIQAALADQPRQGGKALDCDIVPNDLGFAITVRAPDPGLQGAFAVIEHPGLAVGQGQTRQEGGRLIAQAISFGQSAIARGQVRLTVIGQDGAVEYAGCS